MKNLAVITARSGSKGLPDKNILPICGKPLMWYSVNAALESGMYDEVMVSTDSEKYAEIARECGAKVPFLRSEATSSDTASSIDCIKEVISEYKKLGMEFDTVTILQPTTPLRTAEHISEAFAQMKKMGKEHIVSVVEAEHPITWYFSLNEKGERDVPPSVANVRRQDTKKYYRPNGAIYIMNIDVVMEDRSMISDRMYYVMDQESSIDIDSEVDFLVAEFYVKKRNDAHVDGGHR